VEVRVLNPLEVFRRSRPIDPDAYSPDEILGILRGKVQGQRAQAALEVISNPTTWLPADTRRAFGHLAWHAERLPTIFYLYRRGWAPEQIGRRLSPLGGAWAVDNTLRVAANLICERLNARKIAA
jgi:hypothetical protein